MYGRTFLWAAIVGLIAIYLVHNSMPTNILPLSVCIREFVFEAVNLSEAAHYQFKTDKFLGPLGPFSLSETTWRTSILRLPQCLQIRPCLLFEDQGNLQLIIFYQGKACELSSLYNLDLIKTYLNPKIAPLITKGGFQFADPIGTHFASGSRESLAIYLQSRLLLLKITYGRADLAIDTYQKKLLATLDQIFSE
jgi:hypothetical protein